MRIYSSFKDYYDVGLGLGRADDDDVAYVREPRVVAAAGPGGDRIGDVEVDRRVIGFCGRVYYALRLRAPGRPAGAEAWCYDVGAVDRFVASHGDRRTREAYIEGAPRRVGRLVPSRGPIARMFDAEADLRRRPSLCYARLFREHDVPIFVVDNEWDPESRQFGRATLNAPLQPVEFARKLDPYTAFQELSMYVGGVLNGRERRVPPVSDADLLVARGFDEWSFRKPPRDP